MKIYTAFKSLQVALLSGAALGTSISSAQILQYDFDSSGAVQASSGSNTQSITTTNTAGASTDYITADSTGISGLSGDRAINLLEPLRVMGGNGPRGNGADIADLDGLQSFTISGWAKNGEAGGNGTARVFSAFDGTDGFELRFLGAGFNRMSLSVNGATEVVSPSAQYSGIVSSDWTFFAVTYESSTGEVNFFSGSESGSLVQNTVSFGVNPGAVGNIASSYILGNVGGGTFGGRTFAATLDDFRVYGSQTDGTGALDASSLTSIRNSAIPEPGSFSAIVGAAVLLLGILQRRPRG
jgi:hypothetical protein